MRSLFILVLLFVGRSDCVTTSLRTSDSACFADPWNSAACWTAGLPTASSDLQFIEPVDCDRQYNIIFPSSLTVRSLYVGASVSVELYASQVAVTDNLTIDGALSLYSIPAIPTGTTARSVINAALSTLSVGGAIVVRKGGYLGGFGTVAAPTTCVDGGAVLAVRPTPFAIDVTTLSDPTQVYLYLVGDVLLAADSLVQMWARGPLVGRLNVTGHAGLAGGAAQIVQLNGADANTTLDVMVWSSVDGLFGNVSFANASDLTASQCQRLCPACSLSGGDAMPALPALSDGQCVELLNLTACPCLSSFDCDPDSHCVVGTCSSGVVNSDFDSVLTGVGGGLPSAGDYPPAAGCAFYSRGGLGALFGGTTTCGVCPYSWTGYPKCDVPICEPWASDTDLINSAQTPQCYGHGDCVLLAGQPRCACQSGYAGQACTLPDCSASGCVHGDCVMGAGGGQCQCVNSNWTGADCATPVCPPHDCSGHGDCVALLNDNTGCLCDDGYLGDDCSLQLCPGVVDAADPLHTSCSQRGTCNHANGQCTCQPGWAAPDCAQPCNSATCQFTCPLGCNGGGQCVYPGVCQCDDAHVGSVCQFELCRPSSRAVYLLLAVDFAATSSSSIIDDYLSSDQYSPDLIDALANASDTSPSSICLVNISLASATPLTGRATDVLLYPTFAINPTPRQPYNCTPVCPEAVQAQQRLNTALANASTPLSAGVVGYAWVNVTASTQCAAPDCSSNGVCWFGECICQPWWRGSDCTVPSCPDDCSQHGQCVDSNVTSGPPRLCQCDANATAGWRWYGDNCALADCPANCSGHGDCLADQLLPYPVCNCSFGWSGDYCQQANDIDGQTTTDDGLLGYQIASAVCIGVAVLLVLVIWFFPPVSRLFYGARGQQIINLRREIKQDLEIEALSQQSASLPPQPSPDVSAVDLDWRSHVVCNEEDLL